LQNRTEPCKHNVGWKFQLKAQHRLPLEDFHLKDLHRSEYTQNRPDDFFCSSILPCIQGRVNNEISNPCRDEAASTNGWPSGSPPIRQDQTDRNMDMRHEPPASFTASRPLQLELWMQDAAFWGKVDIGTPDDCWPWLGRISNSGHGEHGKNACAHRHAYEAAKGPVPARLEVCHDCDNPACVNPAHLRADTHKANMAEMGAKRRGKPAKVLTEAIVRAAHALRKAGLKIIAIAQHLGVKCARTLGMALQGKTWRHCVEA
jgi:hypothetical protein